METGFREYGKGKSILMLVVTEEENSLMTFEDAFQKNQGALALLQKSILDEAKKSWKNHFIYYLFRFLS